MKEAAKGFASGQVSEKIAPALNGEPVQRELMDVARSFLELQQARHEADYDVMRSFSKAEASDLVGQAGQVFNNWKQIRKTIQADTFLASLLILKALRRQFEHRCIHPALHRSVIV